MPAPGMEWQNEQQQKGVWDGEIWAKRLMTVVRADRRKDRGEAQPGPTAASFVAVRLRVCGRGRAGGFPDKSTGDGGGVLVGRQGGSFCAVR